MTTRVVVLPGVAYKELTQALHTRAPFSLIHIGSVKIESATSMKPFAVRAASVTCWLTLSFLLVLLNYAKGQMVEAWVQRYGNAANSISEGNAVAIDSSGNVIVAGQTDNGISGTDILVIKYSNAGQPLWTNHYGGSANGDDLGSAVAVAANGNVIVTGQTRNPATDVDCVTIAYSSTGQGLWTNFYSSAGSFSDSARAIGVDPDGNVLVSGSAGSGEGVSSSARNYLTLKYSGTGAALWTNLYGQITGGDDAVWSMAVDGSGNVYVAGSSRGGSTGNDFATIAYASNGVPLWTNRYSGAGSVDDEAVAIGVATNGIVFVGGSTFGEGYSTYTTIAYAADGTGLWTNHYNGSGIFYDQLYALAVDGSGNVVVTGYTSDSAGDIGFGTIAYSSAGTALWTNRYEGPAGNDIAHAIAIGTNGIIFVTGISPADAFNVDWAVIAYSAAGNALWTNAYNGLGNSYDEARALATDGNGNVFVTGMAYVAGYSHCATVGYSSTGAVLWTSIYSQPGNANDEPAAVVTDAAGNIFVAGRSFGNSGFYDALTVAYSATGIPQWTNRYDGSSHSDDEITALALDANGYLIAAGRTANPNGYDYLTIKYSTSGVALWTNYYDGPGAVNDGIVAVASGQNGDVVVTGSSIGLNSDYLTIAYSAAGDGLWTNRYSGPSDNSSHPTALAVAPNGDVYVTGYAYGPSSADIVTVAYSSDGAPLWTNRYDNVGSDEAQAIAVAKNGNIIVAGTSGADFITLAYSAVGEGLWTNRYSTSFGNDQASAVAVDANNNIFVTGSSDNGLGYRFVTIKYSPTGLALWTNYFSGPAPGNNFAMAVAVDPSGKVIVTGNLDSNESSLDFATLAYSNSGVPLWTNYYNGPANGTDYPRLKSCLAVGSDGSVTVTGVSDGNLNPSVETFDFVTIKYADPATLPGLLNINRFGNQVVLRWLNPTFGLQAAPTINGVFTNVPGATSPRTNPISGDQMHFRLKAN